MALDAATVARAASMGRRAGEAFRSNGQPTRNPFDQTKHPDLAKAWRRAYLDASRNPGR